MPKSAEHDLRALWPQTLIELADALEAHFRVARNPNPRASADEIIWLLVEHLGGRVIYVPSAIRVRNALRDSRICAEFNGRNVQDLARRYHLSAGHVRAILKQRGGKR